jgi:hypothetical protein
MITGTIGGMDIDGTPSEEITAKFRKTGTNGERTGIGRGTIIGVFREQKTTRARIAVSNRKIEGNTIETTGMIETIGTTSTTSMTSTTITAKVAGTKVNPGDAKDLLIPELR